MLEMFSGFAEMLTSPDSLFEPDSFQIQKRNGIEITYSELTTRLATIIDVADCSERNRISRIRNAIWDTGSVGCSVSRRIADEIGLHQVDTGVLVTATGQVETPIYLLDIHMTNTLVFENVRVFGSPMKNRGVDFLIGMDIISKGRFLVETVDGKTHMEFTATGK